MTTSAQENLTLPANDAPVAEEIECFGAAGPILVFIFLLWGVLMVAAASNIS